MIAVPANSTPRIRACAGLSIGSNSSSVTLPFDFSTICLYSSTVSRIIGSWKNVMCTGFCRCSIRLTVCGVSENSPAVVMSRRNGKRSDSQHSATSTPIIPAA